MYIIDCKEITKIKKKENFQSKLKNLNKIFSHWQKTLDFEIVFFWLTKRKKKEKKKYTQLFPN
jgi:hypothetical protein